MGIFSSDKKTIKDVQSILLVEDTPNLLRDSIYVAITANRSITDDILDNYINGLAVKWDAMRNKAQKDNFYPLGLPNGHTSYLPSTDGIVKQIIMKDTGLAITLVSNFLDICEPEYFAFEFIRDNRGWDLDTNIVSNPPFIPSVSTDVFYRYTEAVDNTTVEIFYWYDDGSEEGVLESELYVPGFTFYPLNTYYHTSYYELDAGGNTVGDLQYWSYHASGEGESPVYDKLTITEKNQEQSPYYPVIPIKEYNLDLSDPAHRDETQYEASKVLCKMVDLNFDKLADGANGREKGDPEWDEENDPYWINPEVDKVDHVYLWAAIDLQTEKMNSIRYLHDYFEHLAQTDEMTQADFDYWEAHGYNDGPPPVNTVTVADANFRVDLMYNYIDVTIKDGLADPEAKVGNAYRENFERPRETVYQGQAQRSTFYEFERSSVVFRKQITVDKYSEVTVMGPNHLTYLFEDSTVTTTLKKSLDPEKNNFMVPLHIGVAKDMGIMNHNALLYDAIRTNFHTKYSEKLKWYESGWFKVVVKVVAVVITIWSWGNLGPQMAALLNAGIAVGYAAAGAVLYAIQIAAKEIADKYGAEYAIIFAYLAFEGIAYLAQNAVTQQAAEQARIASQINGMPVPPPPNTIPTTFLNSLDLLKVTKTVFEAVQAGQREDILDTEKKILSLQQESERLQEEMDAVLDSGRDFYDIRRVGAIVGLNETPSGFYQRTIHEGNIGTKSLNTDTFVDRKLRLDLPNSDIRLVV